MSERLMLSIMASWWAIWYGLPLALLLSILAFASLVLVTTFTRGVAPSQPPASPWIMWTWGLLQAALLLAVLPAWFRKVRDRLSVLTTEAGVSQSGAAFGAMAGLFVGATAVALAGR